MQVIDAALEQAGARSPGQPCWCPVPSVDRPSVDRHTVDRHTGSPSQASHPAPSSLHPWAALCVGSLGLVGAGGTEGQQVLQRSGACPHHARVASCSHPPAHIPSWGLPPCADSQMSLCVSFLVLLNARVVPVWGLQPAPPPHLLLLFLLPWVWGEGPCMARNA